MTALPALTKSGHVPRKLRGPSVEKHESVSSNATSPCRLQYCPDMPFCPADSTGPCPDVHLQSTCGCGGTPFAHRAPTSEGSKPEALVPRRCLQRSTSGTTPSCRHSNSVRTARCPQGSRTARVAGCYHTTAFLWRRMPSRRGSTCLRPVQGRPAYHQCSRPQAPLWAQSRTSHSTARTACSRRTPRPRTAPRAPPQTPGRPHHGGSST